jgi:uncharacterized membrane protein (DUF2068 family)
VIRDGRSRAGRRHAAAGVRAVAAFEAVKGLLVVAVGLGLASLAGKDAESAAEALLRQLHLDPAERLPRIFLQAASTVSDRQLLMLAALAATYAVARLLEAYGLWHGWRWAQWLAALSGAIYLPLEVYELASRPTPLRLFALVANLCIVAYMARVLYGGNRDALS